MKKNYSKRSSIACYKKVYWLATIFILTFLNGFSQTTITCPENIQADNDSGECGAIINYSIDFTLDNFYSPDLSDVLSRFESNLAFITNQIPNLYEFNYDGSGYYISDGGFDMYDGGNYLNTNFQSQIDYTDGVVESSTAFGPNGSYFTSSQPGLFLMSTDLDNVSSFEISGNLGADGGGNVDNYIGSFENYDIFTKRVYNTYDPSVNHLIIIPQGSGATQTYSTNTDSDSHTISNLNSADRLYYLLFATRDMNLNQGTFVTDNEMVQIAEKFILAMHLELLTGLPSGSEFPIGETINSYEVIDGSGYSDSCSFTVTVNDNELPAFDCPDDFTITLDASGAATINPEDLLTPTQANDYSVNFNGTFDPIDISSTGTTISLFDDQVSSALPIGFDFIFYGNTYSDFYISSNGFITFSNNLNSGCCSGQDLPNTNFPNNLIALAWDDLYPPGGSGSIKYETTGLAPNRVLIVDFTNIPFCCGSDPEVTTQLKLFEGSNTIEIHNSDVEGFPMTQGIENIDGTQALTVPGRNSENWTAVNEFVSFSLELIDNCSTLSYSASTETFDCTMIGTNEITFTLSDDNGNSNTCNATVTVEDNISPTASCQNVTAYLDANGNVTLDPEDFNDNSSDNTDCLTYTLDQTDFDCTMIGSNPIVFTVEDAAGNTDTCSTTVTILDNEDPTANCVDPFSISLDANGNAQISETDINDSSTDNCGVDSVSIDVTDFDCTMLGENDVTLTVTDTSGNSSTCTTTVTVVDETNPTANCVAPFTISLNANGNAQISESDINDDSSDNCGVDSVSIDVTEFDCTMLGDNQVTLTVTDASGNSSTCTTTVTIIDDTNPIANCVAPFTIALDANGNAQISESDINDGSSDNCGVDSVSIDVTDFDCTMVGDNQVTLTVTDASGNSSTCTTTVTVIDDINPIANCVAPFTISLDENGNAQISESDINDGSSDNCGVDAVSIDVTEFDCTMLGDNQVTLTVTDASGNSSTCTTTVTVVDETNPIANCVAPFTIALDANGNAQISESDINDGSSDNCGVDSVSIDVTDFDCTMVGDNQVTLTVTDASGNSSTCTTTVTVIDDINPIANCVAPFTISLDENGNAQISESDINDGSSDNCGVDAVSIDVTEFDCTMVGDNQVTLTVTDASGNSSTCTTTVTVVDETNPTANCVAPFAISLDANGNAQISESDINDGSSDNCGVDSVSIDVTDFDCTMVGDNQVTLTVTDASGNSSTCTTTVTVEDNESPIATCQDITVILDNTGNVSITASDIDNGSTDNCAIDSYEIDVDSFDCTMVGMNMVTLTITDTNGNSSTCTSTVTVEDNELPSISCEAITVSLDETGNISILPEDLLTDTFDNCGIENLSLDIDTFDCEDVGSDVEVTIFAQDASGNMTSCTTTVTVIDDLDPVFTCLADQTVIGNVEESYYIVPDFVANGEVSAVDNCDGEMITISQNPPAGSLLEEGEYDFTFVTTDQNGNTAVCISTITVETGDLSVKTPEVSLKSVDLYPNPAENFIIIDNPQHLELKEMVIYDLNGRKVLTLDLENYTDNTQLNISKLEAAQYFAMIKSTNNGVVVKRILRK